MADDLDAPIDDAEGTDHEGDPIAGLRSAVQAERGKRQEAEQRERALETQLAELRGRVDGMAASQTKKDTAQPEMTSAQLRQAVEEGRISEDQAEEIKFKQAEKRIRESVTAEVRSEHSAKELGTRVGEEIGRYNAVVPEIGDKASPQFKKLKTEFDYLVGLGHDPRDGRTELLAARAAFGPVQALEKAGKPKGRETWQDTGGSAEDDHGSGGKDGPPRDMPAKNRDYYRDQIAKGAYSGWKEVAKEWSYKPKHGPKSRRAA
jgi:hypothetical protein